MTGSLRTRLQVPLARFDLEIDCTTTGRVVGLFGPSGAGKTTWLEAIAGLRRPAGGEIRLGETVWFDDRAGVDVPSEARGVGWVPQEHLLFPHLSVRGNLGVGSRRAQRSGVVPGAVREEVVRVLELEPLLDRRPAELSGGERQRVALGRALCSGPRLLLLDEPLASLDAALRRRILPFLVRVREAFDVPMLVVSHEPAELQALCDEVIVLDAGRVVAQGEPGEVLTRADVYAEAAADGYENVLWARVSSHAEHTSVLRLGRGGSGQTLAVLRTEQAAGAAVLLGIPARDILVAAGAVAGISARNQLPATVREVRAVAHRRLMQVDLDGGERLVVELTADAVQELPSRPGSRVHLLVKSSSISVYG